MLAWSEFRRCLAVRVVTTLAVVWGGMVAVPSAHAADPALVGAGDIAFR